MISRRGGPAEANWGDIHLIVSPDTSRIKAVGGGLATRRTNIPEATAAAEDGGRLDRCFMV